MLSSTNDLFLLSNLAKYHQLSYLFLKNGKISLLTVQRRLASMDSVMFDLKDKINYQV